MLFFIHLIFFFFFLIFLELLTKQEIFIYIKTGNCLKVTSLATRLRIKEFPLLASCLFVLLHMQLEDRHCQTAKLHQLSYIDKNEAIILLYPTNFKLHGSCLAKMQIKN